MQTFGLYYDENIFFYIFPVLITDRWFRCVSFRFITYFNMNTKVFDGKVTKGKVNHSYLSHVIDEVAKNQTAAADIVIAAPPMVVPGSDLECCDQLYVLNQNQMANRIADVIDGFM